ncbi:MULTISPECIES: hypothetical protein [Streptomyces]|uniref:hypothetical protein n=1 Tax=Streptomyces TaxID=1883 RepID=UPI0012FF2667|nr:hypothetical protein [Streptomyces durhamensis]
MNQLPKLLRGIGEGRVRHLSVELVLSRLDLNADLRLSPVAIDLVSIVATGFLGSHRGGAFFSLGDSDLGSGCFVFTQKVRKFLLVEVAAVSL